MVIYLLIFFAIVLLANSAKTQKQQKNYFMGSMIFLAVFVGLADMLGGYDRYIYGDAFDEAVDAMRRGDNLLITPLFSMYEGEFGYCAWNLFVGLITRNRYIFILLSTLLMYFLFYRAIKRQTDNPMFALIIFMALTFFFSFTYLRQIMSAAFAWQSLQYVEKRKLKWFCVWMFVAFSFHHSAIVLFPLYFIPFRKFDIKWVSIAVVFCFVLGISGVSSDIFDAYNSVETDRTNSQGYAEETGFRIAYFIEALFFLYFIFKYYKQIGDTPNSLIGLNMSIIFCCILLVFLKSENGGRVCWFYMIGLYSLMTNIFSGTKRLAKPVYIITVCFFLFIRITISWGENGFQILYPYKTFLTNGVRQPDNCHAVYEYDNNYDNNKFYR